MSNQYAQLVERINRIVRDRGDVELMVMLDRIADRETETEQAAALGDVVKILNQNKKPTAVDSSQSARPANAALAHPIGSAVSAIPPSAASTRAESNANQTANSGDEVSGS